MPDSMQVVFVHGACVRDGAWWWQPTADVLARSGVSSVAAELPSCGEGAGDGLAGDAAALRELLASLPGPTVVVAHSYGGIVLAEADADVDHVLLISSYVAQPGESLATFGSEEPAPFLHVDPDAGTLSVVSELFEDTFLQDCREVSEEAAARLIAQDVDVVGTPVSQAITAPTTYLVCADDRGTPADRQRVFAERADAVVELDAGHHPFISQPDAVADVVLGLR